MDHLVNCWWHDFMPTKPALPPRRWRQPLHPRIPSVRSQHGNSEKIRGTHIFKWSMEGFLPRLVTNLNQFESNDTKNKTTIAWIFCVDDCFFIVIQMFNWLFFLVGNGGIPLFSWRIQVWQLSITRRGLLLSVYFPWFLFGSIRSKCHQDYPISRIKLAFVTPNWPESIPWPRVYGIDIYVRCPFKRVGVLAK